MIFFETHEDRLREMMLFDRGGTEILRNKGLDRGPLARTEKART